MSKIMMMVRISVVSVFFATVLASCHKAPEPTAPPRMVKVFTVGDSVESDASSGVLAMPAPMVRDPAALSFDAAGRVIAVMAAVGEQVIPGQALARLDPRDLALSESSAKTQFDAARAELDFSESDFRRYADLHAKGFISKAELDRRHAQLKLARARFEATAEQLGFITLRAIEAGQIQAVLIQPGAVVQPRQVAFIVKLSSPRSAAAAGQRPVGLRLPLSALVEGKAVYKIVDQGDGTLRLRRVEVVIGQVTESFAEVREGLSRGDRIVGAGVHLLADGEPVRLFSQ